MTRACLRWAVLMATLGSILMAAERSHAQICTDYYRFGPIYSDYCPFVDGCMEADVEDQQIPNTETPVAESNCSNASQVPADLAGRAVVAVLEDPLDAAVDPQELSWDSCQYSECRDDHADAPHREAFQADAFDTDLTARDAAASDAPSAAARQGSRVCPHYSYYEDYYGYDSDDHIDSPYSDEPAVVNDQQQTAMSGDELPIEVRSEDDMTYRYGEYIDSRESASKDDDEPAEELVEAQPTADLWDKCISAMIMITALGTAILAILKTMRATKMMYIRWMATR